MYRVNDKQLFIKLDSKTQRQLSKERKRTHASVSGPMVFIMLLIHRGTINFERI